MSGYEGRRRRVGRRTGAHGRRIIGQGRDRNRDGRTMVEDSGRNLGDPTMEDRGRSRDGRIMVADFDLSPVDRIMVGGPDRNLGDRTTVGGRGLSRADRTMVGGRDRNRDGPTVGRDLNPIGRRVGHGLNLRGLTMARDLSRPGLAEGVARAGRQPGSRARLLPIGAPSPPTRATNARSRSDRCGSFRHRVSV